MGKEQRIKAILEILKENGYRITNQRKLLLGVMLDCNFLCCKEIYYRARKIDPSVGIATVYRMMQTLEDLDLINRSSVYDMNDACMNLDEESVTVRVRRANGEIAKIQAGKWYKDMIQQFMEEGCMVEDEIRITIDAPCKSCIKREAVYD